jgi:hypothetical protein
MRGIEILFSFYTLIIEFQMKCKNIFFFLLKIDNFFIEKYFKELISLNKIYFFYKIYHSEE